LLPMAGKTKGHLLESIISYREKIQGKELKEAKRITFELAEQLHKNHAIVQSRTENAIFERLPYLDNLLAGVFEKNHYAKKDQILYATQPREKNDRGPNLCNTRHKYNGAMTEYRRINNL
jgi:ABC-type branched-subunit amino acid transport system ATPase component